MNTFGTIAANKHNAKNANKYDYNLPITGTGYTTNIKFWTKGKIKWNLIIWCFIELQR